MSVQIPHVIELQYPVAGEGGTILLDRLELKRRPTAAVLKPLLAGALPGGSPSEDAIFRTCAAAFGVEPWLMERLDVADFMPALEVVLGFLPAGLAAGKAPSGSSQPR